MSFIKEIHWRCFHCDEVFTNRKYAAEHFGVDQTAEPACKLSHSEGHILTALRKAQEELDRYRAEDNDILRAYTCLEAEKAEAVRKAEELGYDRGVRDMKAQGYCTEPQAHKLEVQCPSEYR